jgi:dihydrofolate reductase
VSIALVWAQSADRFIGAAGTLPWYLPEDLARFRELTIGHPVIMGRSTWESLPERFRPLPGRQNVVLSSQVRELPGAQVAADLETALAMVAGQDAWGIGGARVFTEFLPHATRLEVTQVDTVVNGDTRAPVLDRDWHVEHRTPAEGWATSTTELRYRFLSFARTDPEPAGRAVV